MIKDLAAVADRISTFIAEQITSAGCRAAIVGISGGIDSSLTATLCHRAGVELVLLQMPRGRGDDSFTARSDALIESLDARKSSHLVDISTIYDAYLNALPDQVRRDDVNQGNLRARTRANILYAYARLHRGLVVGTGNLAEDGVLGYFTKYGDGAVDISPIGDLYKSEVYQLAAYLGVPRVILEAVPSAGLWEGQTDEDELGFTYDEAERWHRGQQVAPDLAARIESLHRANAHKMKMPPICTVRDMGSAVID